MASTIISTNFDPAQINLRDLMELYVKKRGIDRSNFFGSLSDPAFAKFMNKPAIEFFESARDDGNPLQNFLDDQEAKGVGPAGANKAYSAVKNLEDNVIHQLKRLKRMDEYADDTNGFPKLTDTVVKPAKGPARSKKIKINPSKLGELKLKLIEYARENPKDAPIVRALLVQMYTGFRPKEIIEMPMRGTIKPADPASSAKGLFLPAGITKMDEAFSVPLTPHLESTLNGSINSINERFGDGDIPDRMFLMDDGKPIPKGSLTRVLKQIEVPGILEDARTGEPIDFLTGAYDLRRAQATGVYQLGFSVETGAKMKGRAIKIATAGDEPRYVAPGSSFFTDEDLTPHVAWHNFIDKSFAGAAGIEGGGVRGTIMISPAQDVVTAGIEANRMSDLLTMDVSEMGDIVIPTAKLREGLILPPAPADTEDVSEDFLRRQADSFAKNLKNKNFTTPKFRMVGGAYLASRLGTEGDDGVDESTIDTIVEVVQDAIIDEAGYQAISIPLIRTGLSVNPAGGLATVIQESLRTSPAGGEGATPDPALEELYRQEQAASRGEGQYAPGAPVETPSGEKVTLPRRDYYVAIGKAEGEAAMALEEGLMFIEPDEGFGGPEREYDPRVLEMSRIAIEDSAIQSDETPGFMSRN